MPQSLPSRPSLEQLKNQAKDLQKSFNSGEPGARRKVQEHRPDLVEVSIKKIRLTDAQLVLARDYGFTSWSKLKQQVENPQGGNGSMESLVQAVLANDIAGAQKVLKENPEIGCRLNAPIPELGFGSTLLIAAVQRTNKEMIDLLLRAGADINARSDWWAGGFGVLDDDRGLARFLIERGARLDAHAAARLGWLDELKELVTADPAAVHARGGDGQTPLHFASSRAAANYLLDHGADIDALDVDHESSPAQYMLKDRQDVARLLVARGCRTDLLMAAALGDLDLVHKHLASDPQSVQMSVSEDYFPKRDPRAGGTIYIWTLGHHKTAHQVARQFGHEAVFQLLMERSPQELKLSQACEVGDEPLFRALVSERPELVRNLSGHERSKVCHAALHNNTQAVRLMLEVGWPVDARGQHGATALHWAAFHGNLELVKIILKSNPPLECEDTDFSGTPLGWAIHGSEHGWFGKTGDYAGTVAALLRAGAKPPAKRGGTPAVQAVLRSAVKE